jgi:hypothetical protein
VPRFPRYPSLGPSGGQQEVATRGGGCRRHHLRADGIPREFRQADAVSESERVRKRTRSIRRGKHCRKFSLLIISVCSPLHFISSLCQRVYGHGHSPPFFIDCYLVFLYSEFRRSRFSNRVFPLSCMIFLCVYSSLSLSFSLFPTSFLPLCCVAPCVGESSLKRDRPPRDGAHSAQSIRARVFFSLVGRQR